MKKRNVVKIACLLGGIVLAFFIVQRGNLLPDRDLDESIVEVEEIQNPELKEDETEVVTESEISSIDLKGKKPEDITWEEYQKMSPEEQAVFPDYFESMEAFIEWYNKIESQEETKVEIVSIDLREKNPQDITWEEYQAMSSEEQAVLPDYFENMDAYTEWYNKTEPKEEETEVEIPSVDLKGKNPEEITWEEYQAMSSEEQAVFPDHFESWDAYEAWYEKTEEKEEKPEVEIPSVDLKGKNPEEITWEEYQAMSSEEQAVFPDYFESMDAYNTWYDNMKPKEEEIKVEIPSIDLNGKNPEDITWEEYQSMSPEEQAIFPDCFESWDAYIEWSENAEKQEEKPDMEIPSIDLKGKNPEEITWEEYQSMSPEEQAVFPDYFESWDKYKAWYKQTCPEN